jgi:hypothetical protein
MLTLALLPDRLENLPKARQLLFAWLGWRHGGVVPLRKDIRPEDLRGAMAAVSVVDVDLPDRIIFRQYATIIAERTGHDRRGENALDMADPDDRLLRIERYRNLIKTPCGMIATQSIHLADGSEFEVNLLMLPVATELNAEPGFVYISEDLTEHRDWHKPSKIVAKPVAHDISYIDIGRGLPS